MNSLEHFPKTLAIVDEYLSRSIKSAFDGFERIAHSAATRLRRPSEGVPSDRALVELLDASRGVQDGVLADYLGGVLAASMTAEDDSDDMLPYIGLVRSMSTRQIRLHYVLYSTLRLAYQGNVNVDPDSSQDLAHQHVWIGAAEMTSAMGLGWDSADLSFGLHRLGLIHSFGMDALAPPARASCHPEHDFEAGAWFGPTTMGVRLFMAGQGFDIATPTKVFFDLDFHRVDGVILPASPIAFGG